MSNFDPRDYIKQALGAMQGMTNNTMLEQLQASENHPVNQATDQYNSGVPLQDPSAMSQWDPTDPMMNAGRPAPGTPATPLNAVFRSGLSRLLSDFKGKVSVASGSRDNTEQAKLYQAALQKYGSPQEAAKWVAPPGQSNHNRGLAADLHYTDQSIQPAIAAAAKKYGLYFPLSNENWHIEPLGSR